MERKFHLTGKYKTINYIVSITVFIATVLVLSFNSVGIVASALFSFFYITSLINSNDKTIDMKEYLDYKSNKVKVFVYSFFKTLMLFLLFVFTFSEGTYFKLSITTFFFLAVLGVGTLRKVLLSKLVESQVNTKLIRSLYNSSLMTRIEMINFLAENEVPSEFEEKVDLVVKSSLELNKSADNYSSSIKDLSRELTYLITNEGPLETNNSFNDDIVNSVKSTLRE